MEAEADDAEEPIDTEGASSTASLASTCGVLEVGGERFYTPLLAPRPKFLKGSAVLAPPTLESLDSEPCAEVALALAPLAEDADCPSFRARSTVTHISKSMT